MSAFVFIHGGSHGKWCWEAVIEELKKAGHIGYALDLPGAGSDPTDRSTVTYELCVQAIQEFIEHNELDDIDIVGHSLAGVLLPEVAKTQASRIRHATFLAALCLHEGESALDFIPLDRRESYHTKAEKSSDNTITWTYKENKTLFFNDIPEDEARQYQSMLTPQPFDLYTHIANVDARNCHPERRYILCKNDCALPKTLCETMAAKIGCEPETVDAGHDVMLSKPKELATILLKDIVGYE